MEHSKNLYVFYIHKDEEFFASKYLSKIFIGSTTKTYFNSTLRIWHRRIRKHQYSMQCQHLDESGKKLIACSDNFISFIHHNDTIGERKKIQQSIDANAYDNVVHHTITFPAVTHSNMKKRFLQLALSIWQNSLMPTKYLTIALEFLSNHMPTTIENINAFSSQLAFDILINADVQQYNNNFNNHRNVQYLLLDEAKESTKHSKIEMLYAKKKQLHHQANVLKTQLEEVQAQITGIKHLINGDYGNNI